ncbi:MAG: 4Fe-4S ferredoxin [Candidatus Lokiarchaeota archaeon]|nr:4Fe-4S ferredoxin [Candidatus Lokiarchaeota archaeon]
MPIELMMLIIMSNNSYERLAKILDTIPQGFSPTSSGSHIRLLKLIFRPEEAELASKMKLRGETSEEMATRLGLEPETLTPLLETMAAKGQIRAWQSSSGRRYALLPFVVGIYEEQLDEMDAELAQAFEEYYQENKGFGIFTTEPPIFRVIPVNKSISTDLEIYPYETAEEMIKSAKSWAVRECICKKQQKALGNECNYPNTVCLVMSPRSEHEFDNSELDRVITKNQALDILHDAEEAGLVHCAMNVVEKHYYICNCCTCCCGILRGISEFNQPYVLVKSDYVATVDESSCIACGICVDRCQFEAITIGDIAEINLDRCIGCGVCGIACPEDALSLVERGERTRPPENMIDWMTQKAQARDVDPSDLL